MTKAMTTDEKDVLTSVLLSEIGTAQKYNSLVFDLQAEITTLRGDVEVARLRLEAAHAEIARLRLTDDEREAVEVTTGWVVECNTWNGEHNWWRNGNGWMRTLRQATVFVKKNTAISKCVQLGSGVCTVREISFSTGRAVYPPSRAK